MAHKPKLPIGVFFQTGSGTGSTTPRFLTNLAHDRVPYLKQVAQETGFRIHITGHPSAGWARVYTREPLGKDHGPLWARYRELLKEETIDE